MDAPPRLAAVLAAALLLVGCSSTGNRPSAARTSSGTLATTAPAGPTPTATVRPTYLALGDSVAAGTGADDPARSGYVPVLAALLSDRSGCADVVRPGCPVAVRNLAVPGATTVTLLRDQLPVASEVLRQDDVATVTVTIGGNDVFAPVLRSCARSPQAPTCTQAVRGAIGQVDRGVDKVLAELAAVIGTGTTVAVMTYYDPLAACRLAELQPLGELVLEGAGTQDGLNDVLRARSAEHGAVVVETAPRLTAPRDFVGGLDCLHPSTSGHARIAEAFADALLP